ncbi:MAG TPA: RNA polymerase sigma-70 factor [Cytophagales bacterium]|nr:RNA polymerase sigma-70 factor [Cytophagales bacterium]HAA23256.1 RNA polymerase sigma-70 factor [Cytophagales bacterium]HAP60217.1 RNA polymerase sigma-70 factor [Cytophagales bacterium]
MYLINRDSYKQLFDQHYTALCEFAYAFCRSEVLAQEAVQRVFIALWEKRDRLAVHTSMKAYLYTATRNQALNLMQQPSHRVRTVEVTEELPLGREDTALEQAELGRLIAEAIESLPTQCQKVYRMKREQDLSYQEIATEMGLSPKTVDAQMGIALRKLRQALAPVRDMYLD